MVFSVICVLVSPHFEANARLHYLHNQCHLMTLGVQVCTLINTLAWVCSIVLCICYTMVYKFTKSVHI